MTEGTVMWEAEDETSGCSATCVYDPTTMIFTVTVSKGDVSHARYFPASYEPKFGMDIKDLEKAHEMATAIADKFFPPQPIL